MENKKGRFISFEGIEGMGKTTALQYVCKCLDIAHIAYVVTREPGGTPIAEAIRSVLLQHHKEIMCSNTELLLIFAGRAQNITRVILPALRQGKWALSDRFTDSSFAYQGGGRGIPIGHLRKLTRWVQGDLEPDVTFLLDAPISVGLDRAKNRGVRDRIETEGLEFFERVRKSYLTQAVCNLKRFQIIHADHDLLRIRQQLRKAIDRLLEDFSEHKKC
ncbi:dTMP kinase [Coxiella endosymbiont of Amblyomma sculptum]|uniref:dTMP kinase n=1 Tax=Coxiella endosymbiont of Amblyomma sculptum TaxID=2487929 RepID=UPI00132F14E6|nr:dTMP kinase [Coxiella endosymbiont of Amblyomma sculptum]QHG92640.1 dTMP kinase [Coxiella endosymbiont of Amblyomma sculptum]